MGNIPICIRTAEAFFVVILPKKQLPGYPLRE